MTEKLQRTCASCNCVLYPEEKGYCDNCLEGYATAEDIEEVVMSEWEALEWDRKYDESIKPYTEIVCPVCYNRHSPTVACESNHI